MCEVLISKDSILIVNFLIYQKKKKKKKLMISSFQHGDQMLALKLFRLIMSC